MAICTWDFPYGTNQSSGAYWVRTYTGVTVSLSSIPIPLEVSVIFNEAYTKRFIPGNTSNTLTTLEAGVTYVIIVSDPLTWTIGDEPDIPAGSTWEFTSGTNQNPAVFWQRTYTGANISLLTIPIPPELSILWNQTQTQYFVPGDPGRSTLTTLETGLTYFVVVTDPCIWVIGEGEEDKSEFRDLYAVYA